VVPMDCGILFVTPYEQDGKSVAAMLKDISIRVVRAGTVAEAKTRLDAGNFDVVLTEANLGDGTWLNVLELTRFRKVELIVTDAFADARLWATAINLGAYDMLAQPFHRTEVLRVLTAASSRWTSLELRAAAS
jgi:DNA-binding NtrC family response regulator